jgi:hypothetical protein
MNQKVSGNRNPIDYARTFKNKTVMKATSTAVSPDGKVRIVLYWRLATGVVGYNLYRRSIDDSKMSDEPINGDKLISMVRDGATLKSFIRVDSAEWRVLQNAFTMMRDRIFSPLDSPVDPSKAVERGLTPKEKKVLDLLALKNLQVRLVTGSGFIDSTVKKDKWYVYELRGVKTGGAEILLTKEVVVQAGHFLLPHPPSGIKAMSGDHKVLVLWNRNNLAYGYNVRRSKNPIGGFHNINAQLILFNIESDLDGKPISPRPGFVDFQRWNEDGRPTSHLVNGVSIDGPENYVEYHYQVASVDILGRGGRWSNVYPATSADKTPPMSPRDLRIDFSSNPKGLALSWRKVTRDVEGHIELDLPHTYRIYRSKTSDELENIDTLPTPVYSLPPVDPTDLTTMTLGWLDTDPMIFPQYGEQDIWYMVRCEDAHGNLSAPSALVRGRAPDITPPGPTKMLDSEGHEKHIRIKWDQNTEPDLAGYQIYRTICDRGEYYRPKLNQKEYAGNCDFALVGEILLEEAKKRFTNEGFIYYDDYSVPEGSPVCYAYWVRAFDMNRNLYPGSNGCPRRRQEYLCARLIDETPPPVPVISALKAKNNRVLIKWIASPVQDLRAFHVYRSEKENDTPEFRGCVLSDGTPWDRNRKWTGEKPTCGAIPAEPNLDNVEGEFLDENVTPNKIYWYRVSALDWLGNESEVEDLMKIPAVSTFTYNIDIPDTPTILQCEETSTDGCGLIVRWNPQYDSNVVDGFVVFRALAVEGAYRQVSPIVKGNEFSDNSAIRNTKYWYCVQAVDEGKFSKPSEPVCYEY